MNRFETIEVPIYHMRGGTSTGVLIKKNDLPIDEKKRDAIIRKIMGVPETNTPGNMQITGLGRGIPTSNKLFIVEVVDKEKSQVKSTLAQLAMDKSTIDWSVNCGNMSSAIPLYLLESKQISVHNGINTIEIFNTNTKKSTNAYINVIDGQIADYTQIPGVIGSYPEVRLELKNPAGSKTGKLFPTENRIDVIDGIEVTCLDVNVPMVIVKSIDLGKTGYESVNDLKSDKALHKKLMQIWTEAGIKMKLKKNDGTLMTKKDLQNSETIPKICMISESSKKGDINTRYFTPQTPHNSLAVSGGGCLAAACLLKGTIAQKMISDSSILRVSEKQYEVKIENPAGVLDIELYMDKTDIDRIVYKRSTQILVKGDAVVYGLLQ
ncbi:PrpF domain-containing protein [Desulfobacter postgatei]|uniref:PrpF domain-containing protein n=1 Tax=Desulfobacter postgatei TaxID=2293 RepID=UPI00259B6CAE|nr:PrpF domain-containing protein [uncultured Desulfobacter sp.]